MITKRVQERFFRNSICVGFFGGSKYEYFSPHSGTFVSKELSFRYRKIFIPEKCISERDEFFLSNIDKKILNRNDCKNVNYFRKSC